MARKPKIEDVVEKNNIQDFIIEKEFIEWGKHGI